MASLLSARACSGLHSSRRVTSCESGPHCRVVQALQQHAAVGHRARAVQVRAVDSQESSPATSQQKVDAAAEPELPPKLTTWEYSKMKEPGLAPWYVAMAFLPFLLLLVPVLSSPPMPTPP